MTTVVLVDDQALIRGGFRTLIESADDLEVVGEADDGHGALQVVRATVPDVVLLDIRMPGPDGIVVTRTIANDPALASVRIIVLTTFELDEYVVEAVRAGASGFLDKGVDPADLLEAIRVVAGGEAVLTPWATRALLRAMDADGTVARTVDEEAVAVLTEREREVVSLVGRGLSNEEIGEALVVSPLTAKTHVSRAMTKLDVRDRAQLVVLALRTGLTTLDDLT